MFPLSINVRSQTATSPARRSNSRTWVSSSEDHLFTISSIVFPRSMDGGGTDIPIGAGELVPAGFPLLGVNIHMHERAWLTYLRQMRSKQEQPRELVNLV